MGEVTADCLKDEGAALQVPAVPATLGAVTNVQSNTIKNRSVRRCEHNCCVQFFEKKKEWLLCQSSINVCALSDATNEPAEKIGVAALCASRVLLGERESARLLARVASSTQSYRFIVPQLSSCASRLFFPGHVHGISWHDNSEDCEAGISNAVHHHISTDSVNMVSFAKELTVGAGATCSITDPSTIHSIARAGGELVDVQSDIELLGTTRRI